MRAIYHLNGPMLVLAGPGSGKTFVITERIVRLLREHKIPPQEILVITFTKAAALEMRRRANILDKRSAYVNFGTFHSVFYQMIKSSYPNRKLSLIPEKERYGFFKALLLKGDKREDSISDEIEEEIKKISLYKNGEGNKPEIYDDYEQYLSENDKIDFDDMLRLAHDLLKNDVEKRRYWQGRFKYILIDEFQDSNPLQYDTLKLLIGDEKNIFAVGDDDQSIYSFRGAKPGLMKKFEDELNAKKVVLNVNYRSGENIVYTAEKFIKNNTDRYDKDIRAIRKGGYMPDICFTRDRYEEEELIKKQVGEFKKDHPDKTQAVLLRTNKEKIRYEQIFKNTNEDEEIIKDILSYFRFINDGGLREDFLRIMNKPMRYISKNLLLEEKVDLSILIGRLKDKPWIKERVRELRDKCTFAGHLDSRGQLRYVLKVLKYEEYLTLEYGKSGQMYRRAMDTCQSLRGIAISYPDPALFADHLKEKLDDKKDEGELINGVTVMTYHGSKGLEFDRVYLPELEYGKVPHGRMLSSEALEEERRMFYVAMTRAKDSLFIYTEKDKSPSPFLDELFLAKI